jgi:hypothetical protein
LIELQDKVEQYIKSRESKYRHYRDVLQPLFTALYQMKHGIRLMAAAAQCMAVDQAHTLTVTVLMFIAVFSHRDRR